MNLVRPKLNIITRIRRKLKEGGVKVLITGGAGFIGSHLSEQLIQNRDEVYVIDDLSTGKYENISHLVADKNFHFIVDTI